MKIKDEFYTAMLGDQYVYVAGRYGIRKAVTPRKTMTFRGEGAYEKVKKKLEKLSAQAIITSLKLKLLK